MGRCYMIYSQEEKWDWINGEISFKDGRVVQKKLHLDNENLEAPLLTLEGTKVISHSAFEVDKFILIDSLMSDTLIFESVQIRSFYGGGNKRIFLQCLFKGEKYSLYRNIRFPQHMSSPNADSVKVARQKNVSSYATDNRALFFLSKDDIAYIISSPKGDPAKKKYKVEKSRLLDILSEDYSGIKPFIKDHKLNFKILNDIILLTDYADSVSISK